MAFISNRVVHYFPIKGTLPLLLLGTLMGSVSCTTRSEQPFYIYISLSGALPEGSQKELVINNDLIYNEKVEPRTYGTKHVLHNTNKRVNTIRYSVGLRDTTFSAHLTNKKAYISIVFSRWHTSFS